MHQRRTFDTRTMTWMTRGKKNTIISFTTCSDNKVREFIAVKVLHTSLLNTTVVAFKILPLGSYAPMPPPSLPFKTILELVLWNGLQSCRCIIRDVIKSSKCLPFNIPFIFGNRKKSLGARTGVQAGCSNTVICLVAKNSLTDSAVWAGAGAGVVMQDTWVVGQNFGSFPSNFFTQPFQDLQIVNLVDCLSTWCKFIMNNPSNIKKKSQQHCFESRLERRNIFGRGELAVVHCALCRFVSQSYW